MIRSVCTLEKSSIDRSLQEIQDCQSRITDVLVPLKMIKSLYCSNELNMKLEEQKEKSFQKENKLNKF